MPAALVVEAFLTLNALFLQLLSYYIIKIIKSPYIQNIIFLLMNSLLKNLSILYV